jgi:non-ribosomal peptide synthase protein (TIGR01720 family)
VHFVPSMLRPFVCEPAARECASLRMVICGGEAITPDLLALFHQTLDVDLHNQYGPSEASVQTAYWPLRRGDTRIALGRGTWNTRLYVLDAHQAPVPQGAVGELCIAGVQLARGYLNQPGLTAERFLPDPYGLPGTRMYATGDLVRWLPNGTLEFLGRVDHQVKVRGFRIDPGEIESQMKAHPAVRNAAVIARARSSGDKTLTGYVSPREDTADAGLLATALREYLSERLPAYMVPASLMVVDALPLNANGKVDLAALPAPGEAPDHAEFTPPRTHAEQVLSKVWRSVLQLERVGTRDNFFALGGDSIRAIEVASASEAAGLLMTPNQLFQHQTLGELAAAVISGPGEGGRPDRQAQQAEATGPACLTAIQRSYFEAGDPERDYLTQYVALTVAPDLEPGVIEAALDHLVRHHDLLRAAYERRPDGYVQVVLPHEPARRLSRAAAGSDDLDAVLDAHAGRLGAELSPAGGQLLRALLIDRPGAPRVLLIVIHHLCVDAVSWRILVEDLNAACRQLADGAQEPRFPAKTASFITWASRLGDLGASPGFAAEARWWRSLLAGTPPAAATGRPVTRSGDLRRADRSLSQPATRALLEAVPGAYRARPHDVLLTALALAAHRTAGSAVLTVDLEGHGREPLFPDVSLTRTVGWFTSVFPVRLELADPADAGGCLMAVKEALRAVPSHGIGFGVLERPGEGIATADILFNYLGHTDLPQQDESLLRPIPEPFRAASAPTRPCSHPVEVTAQITGGQLVVHWLYDRRVAAGVPALADHFVAALEEIIEEAGRPDGGARSASDYPLSGLSTADLRRLFGSGRDVEDIYPLSAVQEGILFHTLAARGADADMYLVQATWELGDIDGPTMAEAWREVARRNPILRTRLIWDTVDRPLQVIDREAPLPVTLLDWSGRDPAEPAAALDGLLGQGRQRGMDLHRAPLARVTLIKSGATAWRIVFEFHHLLLDGWSTMALLSDVLAIYDALVTGNELGIAARRPFRDYIAWRETRATSGEREFWQEYLSGFRTPTPLPVEPGPPERGHSRYDVELPDELTDALGRFTKQVPVTQSTIFQAAWGMLLGQYGETDDVVFGAAVSGRSGFPEAQEIIGMLINTLPVRVRVTPDAPVATWLRALQAGRGRMPSEHTSLTDIARWSEVPRKSALFSSALVFENYPVSEPVRTALGGLSAAALRVEQTANYPLILEVKAGSPLEAALLYDRSRFEAGGIARIARRLVLLLTAIASTPLVPVSQLLARCRADDGW